MAFFCGALSVPIKERTRSARRFSSRAFSYSGACAIAGSSSVWSSRRRCRSLFSRRLSSARLRASRERKGRERIDTGRHCARAGGKRPGQLPLLWAPAAGCAQPERRRCGSAGHRALQKRSRPCEEAGPPASRRATRHRHTWRSWPPGTQVRLSSSPARYTSTGLSRMSLLP